jgi:hypothetical protein
MSLVKKPLMTEEKLAAHRRNQGLSQGQATADARERIGAAHLGHGLYAKAQEPAWRGWGEGPAQFEELLEGLLQEFTPVGPFPGSAANHQLASQNQAAGGQNRRQRKLGSNCRGPR